MEELKEQFAIIEDLIDEMTVSRICEELKNESCKSYITTWRMKIYSLLKQIESEVGVLDGSNE